MFRLSWGVVVLVFFSCPGVCFQFMRGMVVARVSRRGWRAVPRAAVPSGRGGSSVPWAVRAGLGEAGCEDGDLGFPGDGGLGGGGVRELRPCFLRPFGVPLPSGDVQGVQAARAAESAAAASAPAMMWL